MFHIMMNSPKIFKSASSKLECMVNSSLQSLNVCLGSAGNGALANSKYAYPFFKSCRTLVDTNAP